MNKCNETNKETTHGWTKQKSNCKYAGWWDCSFFCNKLSKPENIVPCDMDIPNFEKCGKKKLNKEQVTKKQNQEILKVLEGKIDKIVVEKILKNLQLIIKSVPTNEICDKHGSLNLKKFHARQEVKDTVKKLKQLGVTREYFCENFIIASLIMGGLL